MAIETSQQAAVPQAPGRYQVGTLTYTRMALLSLFFWLLWGNFCFMLMETLVPQLLPLMLKEAGASDIAVGILVGSIPATLNMLIVPAVSFKSDRYRGRWGRRIPFLLLATPFVTIFLILTGYAPEIGAWFHGRLMHAGTLKGISPVYAILGVMAMMVIGFQFFNMFISSVYYYLFADTVPQALLGRFMSTFRIVSNCAGFVWNGFVFGQTEHHLHIVFIALSAMYFISFLLMCWRVKEGEYPPPPPETHGSGRLGAIKTYFAECFSIPYYIVLYIGVMFYSFSACSSIFRIFLYTGAFHLSRDQVGKTYVPISIIGIAILFPLGWLMDKIHPIRAMLIGLAGTIIMSFVIFFFMHDRHSMLVLLGISAVPEGLVGLALMPMMVRLLPRDRFGQFASAQAMLGAFGSIIGNALAGVFMDWIGDYRYTFIWYGVSLSVTFVCFSIVYFEWLRYGGSQNYIAPEPRYSGIKADNIETAV
jgi:maltose/moltooligosaccharide transporter